METAPATSVGVRLGNPLGRWSLCVVGAIVAGAIIFELLGLSVFSRIGMPHEFCYVKDGKLVWLHVVSDVLIGLAYVSISGTLAYLVYRASKDIPFHWVFLAFGLFIVSCGMTHFMEVWVVWEPVYWLSGYVKVLTAIASVATAIVLLPLVPRIFALIDTARKSEQRRLEIEQLNQELERFNYSVAHDLRAPLRGIAGFSEVLREDCGGELSAEAKEYIGQVQTSVARMDALIMGLLKYATVGRQEIQRESIPLDDVLRESLAILDNEIKACGARIETKGPLPVVMGDATMLQVMLQNLIGNAIKFVAPGVRPHVVISAESVPGRATLYITDNGVGIPIDARNRVFRIFERFHPDHPGTGIGFAIVRRAVERLKGDIGVGPAPGGAGTRFWIHLPRD